MTKYICLKKNNWIHQQGVKVKYLPLNFVLSIVKCFLIALSWILYILASIIDYAKNLIRVIIVISLAVFSVIVYMLYDSGEFNYLFRELKYFLIIGAGALAHILLLFVVEYASPGLLFVSGILSEFQENLLVKVFFCKTDQEAVLLNKKCTKAAQTGKASRSVTEEKISTEKQQQALNKKSDTCALDNDEVRTIQDEVPVVSNEKLENLIGLSNVKKEVQKQINMAKINQEKVSAGMKASQLSLHMALVGNPGTGKTTVARIIGQEYKKIGILSKGHVVEVSRKDLVGVYIGETAPKVEKVFKRAMGGILFIDEAYMLTEMNYAQHTDYGVEAIGTLLKLMEDYRDKVMVIVAGYPKEMDRFIASNPGLKSRIAKTIVFEDYNANELMQIFTDSLKEEGYRFESEMAKEYTMHCFKKVCLEKKRDFGNGRDIREFSILVKEEQSMRLAESEVRTSGDIAVIALQDIKKPAEEKFQINLCS